MSTDYKFQGWMGLDENAVGHLKHQAYEPKTWEETDVDIKITHCGICGSDIHTLRSGWGGRTNYPCVVGHEIVGEAVKVGSKAEKGIKVGDRVGVGAQASSCLKPDCEGCGNGLENHCDHMVGTYNGVYPDGSKSYGGYGDYTRVPSRFVFKIPEKLASADAAPMLCGGITVFSPLQQNGCGPGKRVGIVGIGGLGHFGLLFAKALGADHVTAISRSSSKKADAQKMGAEGFIATGEEPDWATKYANSLDLIVSTVSGPNMPISGYLSLLRHHGTFIQVGVPEENIPAFSAMSLVAKGVKFGGSIIGSTAEIEHMLNLAAEKGVKPWIQQRPLDDANGATVDMEDGKARYRYVLVNEKHAKI